MKVNLESLVGLLIDSVETWAPGQIEVFALLNGLVIVHIQEDMLPVLHVVPDAKVRERHIEMEVPDD